MSVKRVEPTSRRGEKDARRHREKQREALKKRLPEIIAEEAIITRRGKKIVKVPIKMLDIPHFRPKQSGEGGGAGVGQGAGKRGDVIGRAAGPGKGSGAGQEPGRDYIETEIELEELIAMMLEDLGLPNLQRKTNEELEVAVGFKIRGITHSGPWVLLHRHKTVQEGMKRFWSFLRYLERETGMPELSCYDALKRANGRVGDALVMLQDPSFSPEATEVQPFPIFTSDDLRFREIEEDRKTESNAVVIAMMDVSGSMTTMKKYLARSMLFWIVEFLRRIYDHVEIRFIIHHTSAKLVDEETFFHTAESGGTYCFSAYELANYLIDTDYPTDRWNVYPFHFSDGEDYFPERSVDEVEKFFAKGISMFGYGEIHVDGEYQGSHPLLHAMMKRFPIEQHNDGTLEFYEGPRELPLLGLIIKKREDVWPAVRAFLRKGRWEQ